MIDIDLIAREYEISDVPHWRCPDCLYGYLEFKQDTLQKLPTAETVKKAKKASFLTLRHSILHMRFSLAASAMRRSV